MNELRIIATVKVPDGTDAGDIIISLIDHAASKGWDLQGFAESGELAALDTLPSLAEGTADQSGLVIAPAGRKLPSQVSTTPPPCWSCGKPTTLWWSGPITGCPQGITTFACPDNCPFPKPETIS